MNDFSFDDLETSIDDLPVREGAKPEQKHPCGRCHGTGKYQGVRVHQEASECFSCKGKGYFKSSAADRQKAKAARVARAVKKAEQAIALLQETNPSAAEWILENEGHDDFARSLGDSVRKYGGLTEKQAAAIQRQLARSNGGLTAFRAAQPEALEWLEANASSSNFAADLLRGARRFGQLTERQLAAVLRIVESDKANKALDLSDVVRAFEKAKETGKKKLTLRLGSFKFSLAPSTSRNAGFIYLKSAAGDYLGKIDSRGSLFPVRECTDSHKAELAELSGDIVAAAKVYGQQTGTCSCCGRELTNPESIRLGIGPICAEGWGF